MFLTDGAKAVPLNALPEEAWTFITGDGVAVGDLKQVMEKVPWLGRGVKLLGQGVASVPFSIIQGETEIDSSENYQNKLGWFDDPFTVLQQIETDLVIHSRSYLMKEANIMSRMLSVRRLYPPTIQERTDSERGLYGFMRTINNRQLPPLDLDDLVHIKLPDPWSELGTAVSPAQNALAAANVLMNMDEFIDAFFKRGAVKVTLLSVSGDASGDQRRDLETWWKRVIGGLSNAFSGKVVNADRVTATPIGEGLEEMGNQNLSKEKREDISTALGIPQSILFSTGAVNRAVSQQDDVNFYSKTVIPDARFIERKLNTQLMEPQGVRLKFKPQEMAIFQIDEEARSMALSNLVLAGENLDNAYEILGFEISEDMTKRRELAAMRTPLNRANGNTATMEFHLEQWRRKSLNSLAADKPAQVDFESDLISKTLSAAISSQLGEAKSRDDVHDIFEQMLIHPDVLWERYP
jgi:phage portal protein BeeE